VISREEVLDEDRRSICVEFADRMLWLDLPKPIDPELLARASKHESEDEKLRGHVHALTASTWALTRALAKTGGELQAHEMRRAIEGVECLSSLAMALAEKLCTPAEEP